MAVIDGVELAASAVRPNRTRRTASRGDAEDDARRGATMPAAAIFFAPCTIRRRDESAAPRWRWRGVALLCGLLGFVIGFAVALALR